MDQLIKYWYELYGNAGTNPTEEDKELLYTLAVLILKELATSVQ